MTDIAELFALEYIKTVGIINNGDNGRGFTQPVCLTVGSDGRIFVLNRADPVNSQAVRVGVCSFDEEYLGEFGCGFGQDDGQFMLPTSMAFDNRDRLYVTDEYLNRVTVFSSSGDFLHKWGTSGNGCGQFNGPSGIAFDSEDVAYVVDQHNNRIGKFTTEGQFIESFGESGNGDGQLDMPWGIATDATDNVYVADWRNDRIQKFSREGCFIATFGETGESQGQLYRPSDVAVDDQGYIYVADWGNERVQVFSSSWEFILNLRGQATLSKWAKEFFASNPDEEVTRHNSNLTPVLPDHLNTPYHVSSQTEPYFWGPISVTLDKLGHLFVTETNRHRFQVYRRV